LPHFIDITIPLGPDIPTWPGSTGIHVTQTMCLKAGDPANVSRLDCDVHIGTHVDAPRHYLEDGDTVDQLSLDALVGPAVVAYLPGLDAITADALESIQLPGEIERLLLRTQNSDLWASKESDFRTGYTALTADAAQWVVDRGIELVGIDYLSIQRFNDSPLTHEILLKANVIVLEGLNLAHVEPGPYELICLPIPLVGAEGAPARALLQRRQSSEGPILPRGECS